MIGYTKREALELTARRIGITKKALESEEIEANMGDGRNHIYKVIAHAGKHSQGRAVLKYAIEKYLQDNQYEYYAEM